jgi:hypothetical protein
MRRQLPRRVKNYLFFRYEDLCTNFHNHVPADSIRATTGASPVR